MIPLPTAKAGVLTVDVVVADAAVLSVVVVDVVTAVMLAEVTVGDDALDVVAELVLSPPQAANDSAIITLDKKTEYLKLRYEVFISL